MKSSLIISYSRVDRGAEHLLLHRNSCLRPGKMSQLLKIQSQRIQNTCLPSATTGMVRLNSCHRPPLGDIQHGVSTMNHTCSSSPLVSVFTFAWISSGLECVQNPTSLASRHKGSPRDKSYVSFSIFFFIIPHILPNKANSCALSFTQMSGHSTPDCRMEARRWKALCRLIPALTALWRCCLHSHSWKRRDHCLCGLHSCSPQAPWIQTHLQSPHLTLAAQSLAPIA